ERELARAAEEELLAELRRMRSSQPTQGEQGTRPRRPTPMRGLLI
ncbi:LcrG family type III secretion system chaperone PcrG, partial [Pseudomonas aeruginosa]|nr:LcrG family type III secretion system chaperone PcrG [Pseudomonas aeruginosa]